MHTLTNHGITSCSMFLSVIHQLQNDPTPIFRTTTFSKPTCRSQPARPYGRTARTLQTRLQCVRGRVDDTELPLHHTETRDPPVRYGRSGVPIASLSRIGRQVSRPRLGVRLLMGSEHVSTCRTRSRRSVPAGGVGHRDIVHAQYRTCQYERLEARHKHGRSRGE